MKALATSIRAQVEAEVLTRLRSAGTLVALLLIFAGSMLWIPAPTGKVASISWRRDGHLESSQFNAAYAGAAVTILGGVFLILVAFYLVAGSVRRDRERHIGAILAATPISKTAYLVGKAASHAAYLGVIALVMLLVGLLRFAQYGQGPLTPGAFLLPFVATIPPGLCFIAAMAVLFDVTPGLRGRGGLVAWFFTAIFLFIALPELLSRDLSGARVRTPVFDPVGLAVLEQAIQSSLPGVSDVSTGLVIHDQAPVRVPWAGVRIGPGLLLVRLTAFVWTIPPLVLAVLLFDRFDPARDRRGWWPRRRAAAVLPADGPGDGLAGSGLGAASAVVPVRDLASLPPVSPSPSAWTSTLAEARLVWETGFRAKWLAPLLALVAMVLPAEPAKLAAAGFLLVLIPLVSEAAAREDLSGTRGLVFAQPGVPRSVVLWKAAALTVLLMALAAPLLLRAVAASLSGGFALVTGLLFLSGFAAGAGSLTGGGRLFSSVTLLAWYMALSGVGFADFCGVFGGGREPAVRAAYLGSAAAILALAVVVERRQRA